MANILFKRGLQKDLPTTATDGVFYLTKDTNRLYVGQGSTMALLNQTVQIVSSIAALSDKPAKNDFYYCTAENVLAVYTGHSVDDEHPYDATKWQQINRNTNDNIDTYVTGVSAPTVTASADGGIVVNFNIEQKEHDLISNKTKELDDIPVSFTISKANLNTANEIDVGLSASNIVESNNHTGVKVVTTGNGADNTEFINLKQGSNVTISVDDDDITIAATDTTYDISASNDKIVLKNNSTNGEDIIDLESGNDAIEVSGANDTITVTHKAYTTRGATSIATPSHEGTFTVIDSITTDKGHVTGYNTKTVTLPEDLNTTNTGAAVSVSNDGSITVTVSDSDNKTVEGTASNALYYTVNGTKVYNQGTIDFYTKSEIDTKLNTIDAMHYCGTVGDGASDTVSQLPASNVKAGDTYKIATAGTYAGIDAEIGDLFIATGTETNGVISSGLTWTYIPSGDDVDTKYSISAANNKVVLASSVDADTDTSVEFTAGTALAVSTTTDGKIDYKHKNVGHNPTTSEASPEAEETFTAIDSITVNDQGHVTGYNTKTVTLPKDTTSSITLETGHKIQLKDTNNTTSSVTLANGSYITLTDTTTGTKNDTLTIGHATYGTLSPTTGTANSLSYGEKFTVVTGVARDAGGHLSGYTTTQMTMPADTNQNFTLSGDAVSVESNVATITTSLTGTKNTNSTATMKIAATASDNLEITGTDNQVNISMVWGTF